MKKAYLVTFAITARVVTEKEGDPNSDEDAWNDVVSKACEKVSMEAPDFDENVDTIVEDTECPYGTFNGEE